MMSINSDHVCLRQGYQCKCPQCQIWIDCWNKELDAFSTIDTMMRNGKSLFHIWERLRAEHPDVLRLHHASIEKQFIEYKMEQIEEGEVHQNIEERPRIKLKQPPPPPPRPPSSPLI